MTYPTTDTGRNSVVDNVRTTVEAIAAGASYRSTIAKVLLGGLTPVNVYEFPCAVIIPLAAAHDDARLGMVMSRLELVVHLRAIDKPDESLAHTGLELMHDLVEDVRKALLVDHTRGGVAIDTHVTGDTVYPANSASPAYAADVNVSVDYRVSRALTGIDPGTAV